MESIAYLDGDYLPLAEARISPLDRGFLFADGVYEVVPVYGGRAFRLTGHLRRLEQSLIGVRIANPHSPDEWATIIDGLIGRNGGGEQAVYLQVTRGVAPRNHGFPRSIRPTVFAMSQARPVADGGAPTTVDAITADDVRRYVQPASPQAASLEALLAQFDRFSEFRDMAEKLFLEHKLRQFNWNVSRTAEAIGIQRSHLYNKMHKYGIARTNTR